MAAQPARPRRTPRSTPTSDARPALARRSERKQQQGINFDQALLGYMRSAQDYMSHRHPEVPGTQSLAALIDQAVREKLDAWERAYADGKALPLLGIDPTPQQVAAILDDPDLTWEPVPVDQEPPLALDHTIHRAAEVPPRAVSWSGLLGDLVTLVRRTADRTRRTHTRKRPPA
ncbi:hypothetical protein [Nocardia acidivorans]|uniref:hypothetical protein n=1 Tax=Nocardia acidivorans TaxID=404580 RepID=UPI00082B57BE|nr:hypothetical protein [Nocardia acidivorans]